jgi:riboflavin kinase/FMN adenylyltransferase
MPPLRSGAAPDSSAFVAPTCGVAVAIGNFDGVHLGHRAVLDTLRATADRLGVESCVYTFDPAPTAVVAPERHQARIQTLADREASLLETGVEHVVVEAFTREFAAIPAERFADEYLRGRLNAKALVIGHDFRFGNMRGGDAERLRAWLPEVEIVEVGALLHDGSPVSSSRIRKLIAAGEVRDAAALLGRPVAVSGTVVHGDARGRTLDFPTANLALLEELRPGNGVYAARVWGASEGHKESGGRADGDGDTAGWPAAVNIGVRPTVSGMAWRFEAHLIGFAGDLYGRFLRVELVEKLRGEVRFPSLEALRAQIAQDVQTAASLLGRPA